MGNNFLIASSKNKTARILFYIFEICSGVVGFSMFVLSIVWAAQGAGFGTVVQMFVETIFYVLVLYGFGKIIDLLAKPDNQQVAHEKVEKTEKKENKEEK